MRFGFSVPAYGLHANGPEIRDLLEAADELGFDSEIGRAHV